VSWTGKFQIKWNGGIDTVTLVEAVCLRLAKSAMSGDSRAIESFLSRADKYSETTAEASAELPEDDEAILDRAFSRNSIPHRQDAEDDAQAPVADHSDADE
jgi:hypothetical protein